MKKGIATITLTALVLAVGTTGAFAAHGQRSGQNCANGTGVCRFVDANGDGICDNKGTNGYGTYFVDANGDGICDNAGTNGCGTGTRPQNGTGCHRGYRAHR